MIIPNPSPEGKNISINLTLHNQANVQLKIFDTRGNLISELFDGYMQEGSQKFNWNCKNLTGKEVTAGVYILFLNFDGVILSEKIIIE